MDKARNMGLSGKMPRKTYDFFSDTHKALLSSHYLWVCVCVSRSVMSYSLQPHGLWPAKLLSPWDFPGKNTIVDCHFLLQGIFLTQGLNPGLHIASSLLIAWATIFFTIVKSKLWREINNWSLVIKDLLVWILALLRPEQGSEVDRISVSFYVKYKW